VPKPEVQILVCLKERPEGAVKPCCSLRGSGALYYRLKDLVRERGLKETVLVTKTGCQHHCSRGTTVSVWPHNHWYGGVGVGDAGALLDAAVTGVELERLRMPDGPWE
jgi:(2Fe-2S) ferredoxin